MKRTLEALLREHQEIQLGECPELGEVKTGEHEVAVLDEDLRKTFMLRNAYVAKMNNAIERIDVAKTNGNAEEANEALKERDSCHVLYKTINDLFWHELRVTYGIQDKEIVALRNGWKVVWSDDSDSCAGCPIHGNGGFTLLTIGHGGIRAERVH